MLPACRRHRGVGDGAIRRLIGCVGRGFGLGGSQLALAPLGAGIALHIAGMPTSMAVMIGMLIADGRLALDEPAPIPRWQRPGDPRSAITIRHLLQMRAGLDHTEAGPVPPESRGSSSTPGAT